MVKLDVANLRMVPISKSERLLFSFLGFRYFWNSPNGNAMPLLQSNPTWLAPIIVIPYMLSSLVHVRNFGGVKYFVRARNEIVGITLLKVQKDTLSIRSLAVSPLNRKRGVGFFVFVEAERLAKQMKLPWLEVEVLKGNVAAKKLYLKFGFTVYAEGRMALELRKRV